VRRFLAAANERFKWIALVGTVVGIAIALWSQREAVVAFDWSVSWSALALSVVLFALAPVAQGVSFWLILRFLGLPSRVDEALLIWMRSFLLRYAPSGALAVVIRVRERERLGATKAQVLTATAYEQLAALVSGAIAAVVAFALAPGAVPKLAAAACAVAVAVAVALRPRFLGTRLQALAARRGIEIPALRRGRTLAAVIALNTASWAATGAAVWVLVAALSAEGTQMPNAFWLLGAYAFAWLLGFVVPLLPGGLGLREGTLAAFLASSFGAGVATALALALRLVNTLGELLAIGAVELGYRVRHRLRPTVPEVQAEVRRSAGPLDAPRP
jgi:glycosyltransferase 2 family protein